MRFSDFRVLVLFVISLPILGSSVSVSCNPSSPQPSPTYPGFPPPSGLYASCSGLGPDEAKASASAQAYLDVSATGGYNTLMLNATALASNFGDSAGQEAHSTADFAEYLQSAGPVRAGYLQVSPTGSGTMGDGIALESFNVSGPAGASLYPAVLSGSGSSSFFFPYTLYANPVPAVLGLPFLLSGEATAFAYTEFSDARGEGIAIADYSFRFFEADGVTPVAVSEVPEPSTLSLGLLFLAALFLRRKA